MNWRIQSPNLPTSPPSLARIDGQTDNSRESSSLRSSPLPGAPPPPPCLSRKQRRGLLQRFGSFISQRRCRRIGRVASANIEGSESDANGRSVSPSMTAAEFVARCSSFQLTPSGKKEMMKPSLHRPLAKYYQHPKRGREKDTPSILSPSSDLPSLNNAEMLRMPPTVRARGVIDWWRDEIR